MADSVAREQLATLGLTEEDLFGLPAPFKLTNAIALFIAEHVSVAHLARIISHFHTFPAELQPRVRSQCKLIIGKLREDIVHINSNPAATKHHQLELYAKQFTSPALERLVRTVSGDVTNAVNEQPSETLRVVSSDEPQPQSSESEPCVTVASNESKRDAVHRELSATRRREHRAKKSLKKKRKEIRKLKREVVQLNRKMAQCVAVEEINNRMSIELHQAKETIKDLMYHQRRLEDALKESEVVSIKKGGMFGLEARFCILRLTGLGVSDNNVGRCMNVVAEMLGKKLNALPSKDVVRRLSKKHQQVQTAKCKQPESTSVDTLVGTANDGSVNAEVSDDGMVGVQKDDDEDEKDKMEQDETGGAETSDAGIISAATFSVVKVKEEVEECSKDSAGMLNSEMARAGTYDGAKVKDEIECMMASMMGGVLSSE